MTQFSAAHILISNPCGLKREPYYCYSPSGMLGTPSSLAAGHTRADNRVKRDNRCCTITKSCKFTILLNFNISSISDRTWWHQLVSNIEVVSTGAHNWLPHAHNFCKSYCWCSCQHATVLEEANGQGCCSDPKEAVPRVTYFGLVVLQKAVVTLEVEQSVRKIWLMY